MATGTVKWFNDAKGYGFIRPMRAARTCSCITPRSWARASSRSPKDAKVTYEARQGQKGPEAAEVTPV